MTDKIIEFELKTINGSTYANIIINGFRKLYATESTKFQGGWNAFTDSGKSIGWFQTLRDIELFCK